MRQFLTRVRSNPGQTKCSTYEVSVGKYVSQTEIIMVSHGVQIEEIADIHIGVTKSVVCGQRSVRAIAFSLVNLKQQRKIVLLSTQLVVH